MAPETFKKAPTVSSRARGGGGGSLEAGGGRSRLTLPGQLLLEIPNNRWLEAGACLEMIEDNIVAGNLRIHSYPNVFLW